MQKLTERQQQIFDLIRDSIASNGMPPTRAEIAQALGFRSPNAAEEHLKALARKGAIELTAGTSRGIRIKAPAPDTRPAGSAVQPTTRIPDVPADLPHPATTQWMLPLVGRVAAGSPILATEHIDAHIGVDPILFGNERPDYLLKVRGLSMRDIGILEGDLLAVRKATVARDGQIVVARLGDEVTVKRLRLLPGGVELLPENPDFQPIVVGDRDDFALEGIAVGLIRAGLIH
ncbi:transcriptional repressor LexA [Pigmentiphaga aceris]|uniref:LexA repressor n=1 Tax=Pigmentiphaga aceris TaxID=1940612 RepID=A0A5C0AWA0_9BURK|nr:transcriptional repressor LexA [Pigmentiphaga aceris]QEI06016.1 transcriptional repressor LexA [Pigmentiphaga aceris]